MTIFRNCGTTTFLWYVLLMALFPFSIPAQTDCNTLAVPRIEVNEHPQMLNQVQIIIHWPDATLPTCYPQPPDAFSFPGGSSGSSGGANGGSTVGETIPRDPGMQAHPVRVPRERLEDNVPHWQYFLETGDGKYYLLNQDTFDHIYPDTGTYEVSLRVTPIYSPIRVPPRVRTRKRVGGSNGRSSSGANAAIQRRSRLSNFPSSDVTSTFLLEPHLRTPGPGDSLILAASYRNLSANQTSSGVISVALPRQGFRVTNIRKSAEFEDRDILNLLEENTPVLHESGGPASLWSWEYENLQPETERTFFLEIVLDSLPEGEDFTIAYGTDTRMNRNNWNLWCLTGLGLILPENVTKDINCTVPSQEPGYSANTSFAMRVRRSRDPNRLDAVPHYLIEGERNVVFDFTAHFQNLGNGPAEHVEQFHYVHQLLDLRTLSSHPIPIMAYEPVFINDKFEYEPPPKPNQGREPSWSLKGKNWRHVLADPSSDLTQDSLYTKGAFKYRMSTPSGQAMQLGDTIFAPILIVMDGDSLHAEVVKIPVIKQPKVALPWYMGVKFGLNANGVFDLDDLSLFHAGIVLRKALRRIDVGRSFYRQRTISLRSLPKLWYQAEILYKKLNYREPNGNILNFQSIDVVPLQFRYTPAVLNGFAGVSAGVKASYIWRTLNQGVQETLPENVLDRTELYWFLDLAVGNILGKPSFSLGYRLNRMLANPVLKTEDFDYHQFYLQFTF